MSRVLWTAFAGATLTLGAAVLRARAPRLHQARLGQITSEEEIRLLRRLRSLGLLNSREVRRFAHLARAYEPGALVEALTRLLAGDGPLADRLPAKRAFLVRVSAEIGPFLPTVPRPAFSSPALLAV